MDRRAALLPGALISYRDRRLKEAGFSKFPETTDGFLEYAKALKAKGTPGGFALGNASGDGNTWVHWLLWSHRRQDRRRERQGRHRTRPRPSKALEYAKQLYETFIPGTASWHDPINNKAFLAGEISLTTNGISIYYAAKNDPTKQNIADDMDHAYLPVGPVGKPTELHLMYPILAMNYTKYPQAAKALIAFMMEADSSTHGSPRRSGYLTALPQRLRQQPGLDGGSEAHAVPRRRQAHADRRRARLGRLARPRPRSPTSSCSTCSPTSPPAARTPKSAMKMAERQSSASTAPDRPRERRVRPGAALVRLSTRTGHADMADFAVGAVAKAPIRETSAWSG